MQEKVMGLIPSTVISIFSLPLLDQVPSFLLFFFIDKNLQILKMCNLAKVLLLN